MNPARAQGNEEPGKSSGRAPDRPASSASMAVICARIGTRAGEPGRARARLAARSRRTQEWDAADNARRREMLAEFEVRVVVHPTGHDPRVAITGMEITPDGWV